ncbi:hypothetical protein [Bacillus sp. SM2101]|uniref:hypothetical protein n=1 Tax=Bacillus sp. SM2101 TaxID=2805366 RepID=UPI001BDEC9B8|nr:hypothetical protein [Bacillus sp. SM2101]
MSKYIQNFFNEKVIPYKMFEIKTDKAVHFIDNEEVIELIRNCSEHEQRAIAYMLKKIDFKNGDVNHFLEHLAFGYVLNSERGICRKDQLHQ